MRLLATFSLALLASFNACAQGIIWSADSWQEMSGTPGASWRIAFDHAPDPFFATPPSLNPISGIFSMALTTNDVGRTFFADSFNEPRFAGFIAGLTDGTNGFIRMSAPDTYTWRAQSEQLYLGRSSLAPDLAGYDITQIGFRVTAFYDWYNPVEERNFRTLNYSLDFYGAPVPEPSTWALLGLGGAAALLLRRKVRQRR